ncbi:MAG: 1-deoxy-D-xylulose-5-phosphate reductoisomerase, partial [Bacillota bacterium]
MKKVALLGSTGSIGLQTLQVAREFPERIDIVALAAGSNADALIRQALEFRPGAVAIADAAALDRVKDALESHGIVVYAGAEGIERMVRSVAMKTL